MAPVLSKGARKKLYRSFRVEFDRKGSLMGFRRRFEVGPVHVEMGEAVERVAERMRKLEAALIYAKIHPRRGRKPKMPPWRRPATA